MIRGIQNGAVLQRNKENVCDITLYSDKILDAVKVSCNFSNPEITPLGDGKYSLKGIRYGGPYTVTIGDETFTDIYVGDVWLLTGQSNMQGIGRMIDIGVNSNPAIRAMYLTNDWDIANHPLHELGKGKYKVHENIGCELEYRITKGAGPGLSFAERMFDITRVPQGVIASAHGGTTLYEQWSPKLLKDGENSLYGATYERYLDAGSNVAGVFWYQGCSDAIVEEAPHYTENMINLVNAFRKDFQADLPFVQVQIGCCSWSELDKPGSNESWTSIREQQRLLNDKIDNFDTVHTVAYTLSDAIHLDAESQKTVGRDAAEAMFCLKYGKLYGCLPGIRLKKMEVIPDDYDEVITHVILTYDNVHGELSGGRHVLGFDTSTKTTHAEHCGVFCAKTDGNRVILDCSFSYEEMITNRYLYYNYGREPMCNIVDSHGRSLPALMAVKIENAEY